MLKVLPIQSKSEQEAICARCGVKYNPELLAYSATLEDKLAGICQFKVNADGGFIYDLALAEDCDNTEVLFVLGRATLNFIDLTGIHKAYFNAEVNKDNEMLVRRIGFTLREDGKFFANLTNFFVSPCQHDK
ncbi:MAG: hypothetical protein U0M06_02935 [Clostridia bacterium]|nr:hypothetical protein [Clostridia bacterium]